AHDVLVVGDASEVVIDLELFFFFFQAEDGIRDLTVTGVQTCALPILPAAQTVDNVTVLNGVYSDAQALRGEADYTSHCAGCHADDLSGYQSILKGNRFMNEYREAPLYRLFEKMKTTMPRNAAGTLSDQTYIDILSYILKA